MWTCRVPDPGYKPRAKPMRQQIMFDVPAGLSIDEIKQVFRCLADEPAAAPLGAAPALLQPERADEQPHPAPARAARPGPPPGRNAATAFSPGQQSLLVTFATNAADFVGEVMPLDKPGADHRQAPGQRHRRARGHRQRPARDAHVDQRHVDPRGPRLDQRHVRRPHLRAQEARQPHARRRGAARRAPASSSSRSRATAPGTSARTPTSTSATVSRGCSRATSC